MAPVQNLVVQLARLEIIRKLTLKSLFSGVG